MKTIINTSYLILGCALLLSSCQQEDNTVDFPDGNDRRIVFHASLPGLTTKAAEIVTELEYFRLTAFDEFDEELIDPENNKLKVYIDNLKLEKAASSDGKIVSDLCVWPRPGHESDRLRFFAYYPELNSGASLENTSSVGDDNDNKIVTLGYKVKNFLVAEDIADQVDFVTAYTSGSMADNLFSGVKLDFNHQLSRIEVKAWGANETYDIEIAGVRIGGVAVRADYDFYPSGNSNSWSNSGKGVVEYVFTDDEETVKLSKTGASHSESDKAASIMGKGGCAMLIPCVDTTGWDYKSDKSNDADNMYISVLLRVTDAKGVQRYPYPSDTQTAESEVKEFGWAALPVTGVWQPGFIYTYTLDYSYGVGLHDPDDETRPGESIISDKVLVNVKVSNWEEGANDDVKVPRK